MPNNFVVYKSSAGSGKTFTLVKEYLKLALGNDTLIHLNYKRILALTFTNKAAAEMRIRIISALINICNPSLSSDLENTICKELQIDNEKLKERAQKLINNLLHHYSDFAVSTIDSFSHKIVKTFAHDLKLPVNFNLETDTKDFYNKVIAQLINEIGNDKEITTLLKEFALNNIDDDQNWDPETNMQEFAKLLQQENSIEHIHHLSGLSEEELNKMKVTLQSKLKQFKESIVTDGKKAVELIQSNGLTNNDFIGKGRGPQNFFNKCVAFEIDQSDINATLLKAIETNKWAANDTDNKPIVEKIVPQLNELANKLINYINENISKYNLYSLINKRIYPILLLNKIQTITNELKQEEQLVFIEEFNSKIFEFIKNEPVSFIYERLGDRYKHFLIDEFQDTSTLQWHNILPLVENSLADGNFNLLVGDGKQSIYRWRNANVRQFALLPELENASLSPIMAEQEKALIRNYQEKVLNTNYRSFSTIIQFNNAIFEYLSNTFLTEPLNRIYNDQKQEIKNQDIGHVTITNKPQPVDALDEFVCGQTLKRIQNALMSGYALKDICVLSNSNKKGSTIANYLSKQNIAVISNDSLLLINCAEVTVITAFLKYLQNSKDLVSATVVLNYLLNSNVISLSQFHHAVIKLSERDLYHILKELGLSVDETDIQTKNLLDCAVYLIERLNLNKNASANIYLRFLLDEITKYMSSKNSNISEFNYWWEKRSEKASLIISENLNAVKIMTIHSSKGLEFPIVIIPYCNWDSSKKREQWIELNDSELPIHSAYVPFNSTTAAAGFSEELEKENQESTLDNINMLYVAFTRAVEQLHIITSVSEKNKKNGVNTWVSNFIANSTLFSETELGYEYGQTIQKIKTEKTKEPIIELDQLQLRSEIGSVKIKGSFLKTSELTENAKQKGILMHYILSKVKYQNDLDHALKTALVEGYIKETELIELKPTLLKLIELDNIKPYFTNEFDIKMEVEILDETGQILRPDRIALSDKETCIIDYKTGKENTGKYTKQMLEYENALKKMNYSNIKKLIVYIEEFKVIEVY